VLRFTLSPDGRLLAVATGTPRTTVIRFWDTISTHPLGQLELATGVNSLVFSPCGRVLATAGEDGSVGLWELASLTLRQGWRGHRSAVLSITFSGDGCRLASGSADTTVLIWPAWSAHRDPRSFDELWRDLASPDAQVAFRAAVAWTARGAAGVRQLEARLPPAVAPPSEYTARRLRDLSSDHYAVRERASRELGQVIDLVEPALWQAMHSGLDLEQHARIRRLMASLHRGVLTARQLREVRAVEVLERLKTPEAIRLLRRLQGGLDTAVLTRHAYQALCRLGAALNGPTP